ncbi:MAG: DNA topoisomerase IV subunit A [Candidatus Woesearchaeota archaeon]
MKKKKVSSKDELKKFGKDLVGQVKKGKNPLIELPVRSLSNVEFDKKSRTLVLGNKMASRQFFNVAHAKKFLQTLEVAKVSGDLLKEKKHASLRDVFYMVKRTIPGTKVNVVDDQSESDSVIEDMELIVGKSREQLNVNANKMGSVAGKVVVEDKGDTIDWSKMGSGGWSIPSNVEDIKFKKVAAKYVLYMEKSAVWERLHEDRFWDKQNCIIMSSQGQTTRGIRRLLQRLYNEHKLPIYVLADWDIYGAYIYSVIKYGSIALAHLSEKMAIPGVRYLGITYQDIENYGLQKHLIKLKDTDKARIKQVSQYAWFRDNTAWLKQFIMMKKIDAKAEIQALSARGISFISDTYLPTKIKAKDFID